MRLLSSLSLLLLLPIVASAAPPTRVASYGPNGTHWPSLIETPFMYDTAALEISVACSWAAIGTALDSIDSTEAANGVRILVADGTLSGSGTGEGATAAISQKGSSAWTTRRVVICPANGQGAVTISSARIDRVKGVAWMGFTFSGVMFHGCDKGAAGWGKYTYLGCFGQSGHAVDSFEFVEMVRTIVSVTDYDAAQSYTGGANITNLRWDGCYSSPNYLATGAGHVDTFQTESVNGGSHGTTTVRDTLWFASNNAAYQIGGGSTVVFTHSALVGGATSRARYALPGGAVDSGYYGAINGAGSASFTDCLIWNPTTGTTVSAVTSSSKDATASQAAGFGGAPSSGSWTLDGSMTLASKSIMDEPSDAHLTSIWADPGVTAPDAPTSPTATATSATSITTGITDNDDDPDETSFRIERSTTSGSGFVEVASVSANVTSYVDSGLTPGTTYYYRWRARNAGGDSAYTSEASATTNSIAAVSTSSNPGPLNHRR